MVSTSNSKFFSRRSRNVGYRHSCQHSRRPIRTEAIAINDHGDILIHVGAVSDYSPKYLLKSNGETTQISYEVNKLSNKYVL